VHFENGLRKKDETEKKEIRDIPEHGWTDLSVIEEPCKNGEMDERGIILNTSGRCSLSR
jgi:hypothetical protein